MKAVFEAKPAAIYKQNDPEDKVNHSPSSESEQAEATEASENKSPIAHQATQFISENIGDIKDEELPIKKERKGGRRKINIEFINNKSRRHVTFSKRKAGLIKKVFYPPYNNFNICKSLIFYDRHTS